jgi:hypothetical protein
MAEWIVGYNERWAKVNGVSTRVEQTPIVRDDAEVKAEAKTRLRDEAWAVVDEAIDQREQIALIGQTLRVILEELMAVKEQRVSTNDPEAMADLFAALAWTEAVLDEYEPAAAAIDAATTPAQADAVKFRDRPIPPVPGVRASDVRAKQKRGQGG